MAPPTLQIFLRQLALSRYRPMLALAVIFTTITFISSIGRDSSKVLLSAEEEASKLRSALSLPERTGDFPPLLPEDDQISTQRIFDDSGDEDDKFLAETLNVAKDNFDIAKALRDINLESSDGNDGITTEIEKTITIGNLSSNSTEPLIFDHIVVLDDDKNDDKLKVKQVADEKMVDVAALQASASSATSQHDEEMLKSGEHDKIELMDVLTTTSKLDLLPIKQEDIQSSPELEKLERKNKRRLERLEQIRRLNQSLVIL